MQKINPIRWIFIIQFIFIQSFALKAQVLDATFSSPTQSVCAGSYYTINANTSTYSYSSYNWSISGLQNASYSISGSSITIFAMSPGSCNVTLTVSEGGSTQTHTENNFFTVLLAPDINDIPDTTLCGTYNLPTISGTNLNGSQAYYSAPNGTGMIISNGTVINTTQTIYIYNETSGGCNDQESFIVTINLPVISNQTISVCSGETFTFSPSGPGVPSGTTYSWSAPTTAGIVGTASGTNQTSINGTLLNTTTTPRIVVYSVTPTFGSCVGQIFNLVVTVNPLPAVPNQTTTVCSGEAFTFTPSGSGIPSGTTYTWGTPSVSPSVVGGSSQTVSQPNISQTLQNTSSSVGTASYIVTPTANSCSGSTFIIAFNVTPIPSLNPTPDQTVCSGDFTQPVNFTSSNPNTTYSWYGSATLMGLPNSGTGIIPAYQVYNLALLTEVDSIIVTPILNSCSGISDTFLIIVKPKPVVMSTADQMICSGQFTQPINFSGTQPDIVYYWTHTNPTIGLAQSGVGAIPSFVVQNALTSTQVDNFVVTPSLNGCVGYTDSFLIVVLPIPVVVPNPDLSYCSNDTIQQIIFNGNLPNIMFNWASLNISVLNPDNGSGYFIPSTVAQNNSTLSQTSPVIVTPSVNGCFGVADTFSITILPLPTVNAGSDVSICQGASFVPLANGNASNYQWSNGLIDGVGFVPFASMYLSLTGSLDGCSSMDSVLVSVNPNPTISLSSSDGEDSLACDGAVSVLVTSGTAPFIYNWTNGTTTYTTPAPQGICSGTYSVVVTDMMGCSTTGSVTVNDTLINPITSDTLIFTDDIYMDSTVIGSDTSAWIQNCTFDYTMATGAMIDSYVDSGDSTIVSWIIYLNDGSSISLDATYFLSPGTAGVYDLTLQLVCSQKSGPKFIIAQSRMYYEGNITGIQTLSKNVIHVFPNPANSTISVSGLDESFKYEIIDLQGKCVAQGENHNEIDITTLKTGTYLIFISTDKEMKQLRFVKL